MNEVVIAVIIVGTVLGGMGAIFLYRNSDRGADSFIDHLRTIKYECLGIK